MDGFFFSRKWIYAYRKWFQDNYDSFVMEL